MTQQIGFTQISKLGYILVKYVYNEAKSNAILRDSMAINGEQKHAFNKLVRFLSRANSEQRDECYYKLLETTAKRVPFSKDRQAVITALRQNIITDEWCLPIAAFENDPFVVYLLLRMLQDFNLLPKMKEAAELEEQLSEERARETKDIEKIRKLVESLTKVRSSIETRKLYTTFINDYEESVPKERMEEYGIPTSNSNFAKFSQILGYVSPTVEALMSQASTGDSDPLGIIYNLQNNTGTVRKAISEVTQKAEELKSGDTGEMLDKMIDIFSSHTSEEYRDTLIGATRDLKNDLQNNKAPKDILIEQLTNYGIDMDTWQDALSGIAVPEEFKEVGGAFFNNVDKKD